MPYWDDPLYGPYWDDPPAWRRSLSRYIDRPVPATLQNRIVSVEEMSPYLHPPVRCLPPCPFHAPSDHSMQDWPFYLGEVWILQRACLHGVPHPDPDTLTFLDPRGTEGLARHECDGCCRSVSLTTTLR